LTVVVLGTAFGRRSDNARPGAGAEIRVGFNFVGFSLKLR
jgi:hypothetical protein